MDKIFSDFIKTLTPEVYDDIAKNINKCNLELPIIPVTDEAHKQYTTTLTSMNMILTLEVLKHYHNWLNK